MDEPYPLPAEWRWEPLEALAEVRTGVAKGRALENSDTVQVPYLRVANVQSGYLDLGEVKTIEIRRSEIDRYSLKPNDVLFTEGGDRDKLGRGAVWKGEIECCVHQNHVFAARLRTRDVLPAWVSLASQAQYARDYFMAVARQTVNLASINATKLRSFPVPVPPIHEQRRLLAKHERLTSESRTARKALDRVPALLKRFRQAVLAAAFRGELTERDPSDESAMGLVRQICARSGTTKNTRLQAKRPQDDQFPTNFTMLPELPNGWAWTNLGSVFLVTIGSTPSRKQARYWNGNIPWVSSGEVAFGRITDTREKITQAGIENSSAKLCPPGTVLLAMIGEGKTRGQAAILDVEACTNQNVAAIMVSETPIAAEYLFYWLMYRYDETREGGSGGAQPALNGARVRQIPLPLAPLNEQRRIVARLGSLLAQATAIEEASARARARAEQVDQAFLARAFRGEL